MSRISPPFSRSAFTRVLRIKIHFDDSIIALTHALEAYYCSPLQSYYMDTHRRAAAQDPIGLHLKREALLVWATPAEYDGVCNLQ